MLIFRYNHNTAPVNGALWQVVQTCQPTFVNVCISWMLCSEVLVFNLQWVISWKWWRICVMWISITCTSAGIRAQTLGHTSTKLSLTRSSTTSSASMSPLFSFTVMHTDTNVFTLRHLYKKLSYRNESVHLSSLYRGFVVRKHKFQQIPTIKLSWITTVLQQFPDWK